VAEEEKPLQPEPKYLRMLQLMAEGRKDDAVARAMGISVRTVRRFVAEASMTLGAKNRVHLAVEAMRRGWIE